MQIQTSAQVFINAGIETVFDTSTDCQNLPKFFTGYRAIPAIVSARTGDGLSLCEGGTRIVVNSDGSSIEEVIVGLKRPEIQQYKLVKGVKPPFSWLVRLATGDWSYQTIGSGTQVTWNFRFEVRNILAYAIFQLLVKKPFQKAQDICLKNLKGYIESRGT